ncbi:MAG: CsbD family protein [Spirochaetales bacterium]|nr:MAG: CsbD family protein [Spirochaetales bacterium]
MGEMTDKSKGRIKQAVGDLTGNEKLKREGERDELRGQVKGAVKDVKRAIKKAVK